MRKMFSAICGLLLLVGLGWVADAAAAQARKRKASRPQKTKSQPTPTPTPAPVTPNPLDIVPRRVEPPAAPPPASDKPLTYKFRGKVVEIYRQPRQLAVAHEAIPGYMEVMTMKFPLKDESLYAKLKVGDIIEATLVVSQNSGDWWLEDVRVRSK